MNFIDNGPEKKGAEPSFTFTDFEFDPSVEVAPVIYADMPHRTTRRGVIIGEAATSELQDFLAAYTSQLGVDWQPYFRLDVYPVRDTLNTSDSLEVLEVNSAFVDGWGTALNLSRAAKIPVGIDQGTFPKRFGLESVAGESERYRPELNLLVEELKARNIDSEIDDNWRGNYDSNDEPVYVYGRPNGESAVIMPREGLRLDSKQNLADFSAVWEGQLVKTPFTFSQKQGCEWSEVHGGVYLKFVDKSSSASERAGWSVRRGKPKGKAPFLRRSYQAGDLVAQEVIPVFKQELKEAEGGYAPDAQFNVQLVILGKGKTLTGYVQYASPNQRIINDNSIQGPLKFEGLEEAKV